MEHLKCSSINILPNQELAYSKLFVKTNINKCSKLLLRRDTYLLQKISLIPNLWKYVPTFIDMFNFIKVYKSKRGFWQQNYQLKLSSRAVVGLVSSLYTRTAKLLTLCQTRHWALAVSTSPQTMYLSPGFDSLTKVGPQTVKIELTIIC